MTIGPAPMIRIEEMSVRLGIELVLLRTLSRLRRRGRRDSAGVRGRRAGTIA